ncbi:hypothetical protein [Chryseobacterium taklimakanense]|nr:hypothetical protein [Chryseobacterium taklimakanense]
MMHLKFVPAMAGLALMTSCSVSNVKSTATVIKDCTGTYLRINKEDYQVCNADILKNHQQGSTVSATYRKVQKCPELDGRIVCAMYHEKAGNIRIHSIN